MSVLKRVLIKAAGNRLVQTFLEKNVRVSQYLMGVGAGSGVLSSSEQAIFKVLAKTKSPSYCIFDVGANKGQFLRLVTENVTSNDIRIHCFEPGHETFRLLAESCKGNKRVKLNNIGLSKEKGEALLHYDDFGSGLASLTKRNLKHFNIDFGKSEKVVIDTIDNYCFENSIDHIHLLKIDIEGHELDALAGATHMFATKSIDIVTFEFGGCNIDTRVFFQDFWYFFSKVNFSLFRITPSGYLHPLKSYREMFEQFTTTNFLALANG